MTNPGWPSMLSGILFWARHGKSRNYECILRQSWQIAEL